MNKIVLKHQPQEFCVTENLVLPPSETSDFYYYQLSKQGYNTFDAISQIATSFQINAQDIGYAGLKDEDGYTKQTISMQKVLRSKDLEHFNKLMMEGSRFICLRPCASGDQPIRIGKLTGNGFYLTARNISYEAMENISKGTTQILYINYYGTQRFGLPQAPKVTHLIGKALLEHDFEEAFELLKTCGSSQAQTASNYSKNTKQFFLELDPRIVTFYANAYGSYCWNRKVAEALMQIAGSKNSYSILNEGIPYQFAKHHHKLITLMAQYPKLSYCRYKVNNELQFEKIESSRSVVLQSMTRIENIDLDEVYDNHYKLNMNFFISKGSYATMMTEQFFILKQFEEIRNSMNELESNIT